MTTARQGTLIVVASFLIQGVTVGGMFAYGLLFTEFEAAFGWSRAMISGAVSVTTLVMGVLAMLFGRMGDRLGPRGVLSFSALCYGAGYALLAIVESPWQLYLFWGLLVGAGLATHDVVTLSTIARWFPERRGVMSAVVKVGTAVGQFTVPLVAVSLVAAFGWRIACLVYGVVSFIVLIAAAQVMRHAPDGAVAAPRASAAADTGSGSAHAAFRSTQFWILCGSQFIVFVCLMTTTVHVMPLAVDLGAARGAAASMLAVIGGMSILGRLLMGRAFDRIGGRRGMLIAYGVLLASFVWLQFVSAPWMLFVFVAVYGMAHGAFFVVMAPTVAELFGTRAHGTLFGVVLFFGSVGGAIGPFATGAVFDATGHYRFAFGTLALLAAIGMVLVSRLARVDSKA
jgi:MFS family permease